LYKGEIATGETIVDTHGQARGILPFGFIKAAYPFFSFLKVIAIPDLSGRGNLNLLCHSH